MTLSQFEALISRFGPVVDRWPSAQIDAALDFMQGSAAAQDLFARASAEDLDDGEPGLSQASAAHRDSPVGGKVWM
jgi:hypothetical protein